MFMLLRPYSLRKKLTPTLKTNLDRHHYHGQRRTCGGAVNQLLDKDGIDPESRDNSGRTTLSWVAGNGDSILAKKLIEMHGVDVNSKDRLDRTPLSWAADNGHQAIVQLLLAKECVDAICKCVDAICKDSWDRTPLS
uniref:Ankyrin n=1 Tax=Bionectria ochroleuca TaxID=29856 RepID=A0A8H7K262_BIOOC